MRPALNPALRPLWRDEVTLQLGLDPRRAVVVEGVGPRLGRFLLDLNGRDQWAAAVARAAEFGVPVAEAERALHLLQAAGALVDRSADDTIRGAVTVTERDRLAPDLAAWSLTDRDPAAAARTLRRRSDAHVQVIGSGRVGATLTRLLAATGVGRVEIDDDEPTRPADLSPGGLCAAELGRPRGVAAEAAAAGPCRPRRRRRTDEPALVVLCPVDALPRPGEVEAQLARGSVHLLASLIENVATVGPLVHPGRTPCLRCLDLHRRDRDPAWPILVAQLTGRAPRAFVAPSDGALAAAVAAQAALAVLALVDEPDRPHPLAGAVVQLDRRGLPGTRRTFVSHPGCGCGWQPEQSGDEPAERSGNEPAEERGGRHPSQTATMGT